MDIERLKNLFKELEVYILSETPNQYFIAKNTAVQKLQEIAANNPNASEFEIKKAIVILCDFIANPDKMKSYKDN